MPGGAAGQWCEECREHNRCAEWSVWRGGVRWAGEWRVRTDFIQKGTDTQQGPVQGDGAELGG